MKEPLKFIFAMLIIIPFVIFAIQFMFEKNENGNYKVFDSIGSILESADMSDITNVDITLNQPEVPIIKYCAGVKQINTMTEFKEMFTVTTENGTKNGKLEDDFALYLFDIRNVAGMSVVECLTIEQIESLEVIPSAFIYNQETDILFFNQSGIYTVIVDVYGSNGNLVQYEFLLPVEVKE